MPAGEPNPDAPATVWAGEYDAQAIADATGASWAAPLFALHQPRVVNIAELCAAPAPSAPAFTTTDLVMSMNIFADQTELQTKLVNYVNASLWRSYCTAVDDPEPAPLPTLPPPADLPPTPVPVSRKDLDMEQLLAWTKWIAQNITPRSYHGGTSTDVSGTGHWNIPYQSNSDWTVFAIGVEVTVTAKPDYAGRSNGGDFPVYYDLGWFTLDSGTMGQQPVRLQHDHQIETASVAKVTGFWYNLPPNVEIHVRALYPDTPGPLGEG